MIEWDAADGYQFKLQDKIRPILNTFLDSRSSVNYRRQIYWFNQLATTDYWASNDQNNADIFNEKMYQYNVILQKVLK